MIPRSQPLDSLADVTAAIDARRYPCVESLYTHWLTPGVPTEIARELLEYAAAYHLDVSHERREIYPVYRPEAGTWLLFLTWEGIANICRQTGLWMPGRTTISELAQQQFFITGSCWIRHARTSETWVEVSEAARFASHFARDYAKDRQQKAEPVGDWMLIPELKLSEVAGYLASAKALGEVVTRHECALKYPPIMVHHDAIEDRIPRAAAAR